VPPRHWRARVEDILDAIARIHRYTEGMDAGAFTKDQKTIDAVVRNLEIIGEASRNIPEEVQNRHPTLPWSEMRAMRNLLSHAYFLVDVEILWKTVHEDLAPVTPSLRQILAENP
jgi:uncharacterized protein with HEPN domain